MIRRLLSLLRCAHQHTTFPQGPRQSPHITCLDCGREFPYDFVRMCVKEKNA